MPDKKRRNLFEEHIESEDFDVGDLGTIGSLNLSPQLTELLTSLPQPLDYRIWDEYLDERQKLLCAQLTIEIIDRVLRDQFPQEVMHLSDDELIYMLTVPVALSVLVESQFSKKPKPTEAPVVSSVSARGNVSVLDEQNRPLPEKPLQRPVQNPEWANALGQFVRDTSRFFKKLFRRT